MKEDTLEGLIAKIKTEGVEEAKRQAEGIIRQAEEKAESIVKEAKRQAAEIVTQAEEKARLQQKNAQAAINQAARDVVLRVKEELAHLFEDVLHRQIKEVLDAETVAGLIGELIRNWAPDKEIEITVSPQQKSKLEELILTKIKEEAEKGITIKVDDKLEKGFYIGLKGSHLYYDFSDESILESLKVFLSPSLVSFMQDNNG